MPRLLTVALIALLGCSESSVSGKKDGGTAVVSGDEGGASSPDVQEGSSTNVSEEDIAALVRPAKVPALSFKQVRASARSKARALNGQGLRLYGERKYRAAIGKYVQALQADPGHILARYNLSCAYNLVGEPEKGLALLNEFRQRNCKECRARLVRASEDADWHSMWNHPLFVELVGVQVGDAEVEKPFWEKDLPCKRGASLVGKAGREIYCARAGIRTGPYARWHEGKPNKLAEVGRFDVGRRDGTWQTFDVEGRLSETGPYKLGNKQGVWSQWYPAGSQSVDGRFVSGQRHGRWTWFEESGAIVKQADYVRGRRGAWIVEPKASGKKRE